MAPIIKPGIQPKNITNSPRARVGGVVSPARKLSPLVENISAKNPFSNIQRRNPELRNVRGARTLTNMMSTFGTAKNEKIIRKNLQLLRNSLVESFEMAKLLRTTGNETGKQISKAGLIVGAALGGLLTKLFGKDKSKKKGDEDDKKGDDNNKKTENQFAKSVSEFFEGIKGAFAKGLEQAKDEAKEWGDNIKTAFDDIGNIFIGLRDSVEGVLATSWEGTKSSISDLNERIGNIFNDITEWFSSIQLSWDGVGKAITWVGGGLLSIWTFMQKLEEFRRAANLLVQKDDNSKPVGKSGGQIIGPSHGQGGVDINAEGGEVLMSNAAGNLWGRDNLLQMNAEAVTGKKKKKKNPLLNLTADDYKWLAYAISGEAERGTDDEFGVAASILNRVASPHFKGSVEEVVNNPGQYEAITKGNALHDKELAAFLQSPEGQKGILEALEKLQGRTDFKGQSQLGNRVPEEDPMFSDKGNFFHYWWQQPGAVKPDDWVMPNYQQFINQSKVDGVKNKNVSSIESQLNKGGFINVALGNQGVQVIPSGNKKTQVVNSTPASTNGPSLPFLSASNPDCSNLAYKALCNIDG
tara:strand:- start:2792 stop:4534 length:1743 start_codon:yes stop_codon:yes gene_type:complete